MSSFGVWWIEIVAAVVGGMSLAFVIGEVVAFVRVLRIRQRDGGIPAPRTKEEVPCCSFPMHAPAACRAGENGSKGGTSIGYGASEFVDRWQCADCAHVEGDNQLSPMSETETTKQLVRARQRWFISTEEAERIERPRLGPEMSHESA